MDHHPAIDTNEVLVRGLVQLPMDSDLVTDADEEVFLLYTALQQASSGGRVLPSGLGHVDSRKDTLTVRFELNPPAPLPSDPDVKKSRTSSKGRQLKRDRKVVEVELAQDKTALRSRKGDTGSVLWRVSIEFAQLILQQQYDGLPNALFHPEKLAQSHVYELGAGTGLLSVVLSQLVHQYTPTDIPALLPLIRKNIALNTSGPSASISAESLDWQALLNAPFSTRARLFPMPSPPPDILLAVDCVYHPSLVPALIEAIDHFTVPKRTAVVVAVELRSEEVVRVFLEAWCTRPGWEVRRVGGGLVKLPYVLWVGWKGNTDETSGDDGGV